ncbi:uncharacterized protein MONOS_6004 [Monocercomonoides exilis]|uniref:uncharacterized protein n=1 Tax=Monocercomonoides exilis TaxID=2049356 RepID=UPI00355A18A6|nr:hypothetical protein MONOS_6004 [Monocercomonoides exilis]|eukprot:MONOS_6004.1-p1 / transcript=MONOS_6004.1 / gene=MONOS_6004 / organism=Monocercomonoides_exilis_PA203 / gene_product=unspecified product / transcript_product=unspecified product / location=Mono_scaffold00183:9699-13443(-) / protein_length=1123 / sequence_SO=supercontig / SO=protein_coding / is_pseudo=false
MSSCTWKEMEEGEAIPEARHSMAYASNCDKLYIFGGISASGFLNDVWEFNAQTNKWRELKIASSGEGPKPCSWAGMLVSNGYAVVYGGDTGNSTDTKLRMFRTKIDDIDPVWEEVKITDRYGNDSNVPESRSNYGHSTFISYDGAYSYIFGGCPINKIRNEFNSLLILDCSQVIKSGSGTLTARFKTIKPNETNKTGEKDLFRVDSGCATDKDGNLFIFGGRTQPGINSDLIVVLKEDLKFGQTEEEMNSSEAIKRRKEFRKKILYGEHQDSKFRNSEMEKISTVPKTFINSNESDSPFVSVQPIKGFAPSPRLNPIIVHKKEGFFVYGGRDPISGEIFDDVYVYDIEKDKWSEKSSDTSSETPPARELSAFCMNNKRFLLFGGLGPDVKTGKVQPSNELWEFSFIDSTWKQLGKDSQTQPYPVFGASASIFMDYLIVLGGELSDGTLNKNIFVFTFSTETWEILYELGVKALRPTLLIMNMNLSRFSKENIINQNLLDYEIATSKLGTKIIQNSSHHSKSQNSKFCQDNHGDNSEIRPVLVSTGGQDGTQPFISYYLFDIYNNFEKIDYVSQINHSNLMIMNMTNKSWIKSECEENDKEFIFHHVDGMALPMRNRVLMFGGEKGKHAMDSFKIIEFDEFGKANVTEDDGAALGGKFHLDIVEAGCTVFERSIFCFGGREVNKDGTIIPGAVDKFRFFNLTNVFPCSQGTKESDGKCVKCKVGEYSDFLNKAGCLKCPPGTHDHEEDAYAFGCKAVPKGYFTNESGLDDYENCSDDYSCPIGSAAENKGYENKTILSQPSSLEHNKFESLIKGCMIAIPVGVGVLIAILLLFFPTKAHLFKLDRFSDKYVDTIDPVTHSSVKYIRKTTLGETKTFMDSSMDDATRENSMFENKKVLVEVTLIDYAGSCVEGAGFSTEISGPCSEKLGIGKGQNNPFQKGASCRAIKVLARVDSAIPELKKSRNKQNQTSSLEQVYVNDYGSALGGPISTNVTIELFHSVFYKRNVIQSFNSGNGHLVNKMSFDVGSTADETNLDDCFGFGMNIIFKLDKTSLITHHTTKVRNILPIVETFLNINWPCGRKVKKKLDYVFQDSLKKKERKSVQKKYIEEMNESLDNSLIDTSSL